MNPRLVAFLKKHLEEYTYDELREGLVGQGLPPAEIDAALRAAMTERLVAAKPRKPKRKLLSMFSRKPKSPVGATVIKPAPPRQAVKPAPPRPPAAPAKPKAPRKRSPLSMLMTAISLVSIAWYFANQNKSQTPGDATKPAEQSKSSQITANGTFLGHYPYVIQLPGSYNAVSEMKGPTGSEEVVYFAPPKTDPTQFPHEGLYGQLGIFRLQVSPRRMPTGQVGLAMIRSEVSAALTKQRDVFTMREQLVDQCPAIIFSVTAPFPRAQAFVIGRQQFYILTAGADDATFQNMLSSLHETSPQQAQEIEETPEQ